MRDREPGWAEAWGRREPWAIAGVALGLVIAFGTQAAVGAIYPTPSPAILYALGAHATAPLWHGEWYRLPLGALLHGGVSHFVINLGFLMGVGPLVERRLGAARTLVVLGISGLVAGLLSVIGRTHGVGVGASGMGAGLVGSLLAITWRLRAMLPDAVKAVVFGVVGGGFLMGQFMVFQHPELGIQSHLAGLATGALVTLGLERLHDLPDERSRPRLRLAAAALVAVYAMAPLAAWHALASGRACTAVRAADWGGEEGAAELREAISHYGPPCLGPEGTGADRVTR